MKKKEHWFNLSDWTVGAIMGDGVALSHEGCGIVEYHPSLDGDSLEDFVKQASYHWALVHSND